MLNLFLATGNVAREGAGCMMITGQGNGQGGREHGQKCDQLPGMRSIADPDARRYIASVWGVPEESIPGAGLTAVEIMQAIHSGEIKALLSMCFNPIVSLPDAEFTRQALSKLEFFGVIDFFLSETAAYADLVVAGSLQEEDEGIVCSAEGRVLKINKAVDPPGDARSDALIICDLAQELGRGEFFTYPNGTRDIYEELRVASRGGLADYYGITWDRIERELGVFWPCPSLDHPGTPRLFADGRFAHADGKAHMQVNAWRESGDPDEEFPVYLTTGRVVSQYLSGTQTRRIGPLVDQYPEPTLELHPTLAARHGIADGDWVTVATRRAAVMIQAMVVTDHPSGHGVHPVSLAWPAQREPAHAPDDRSAQQDSRVQSVGVPT